jgi:hypothetical protein
LKIVGVFLLQEILDWRTSREFFYWRLKRRLGEDNAIKTILTADSSLDYHIASNYIQQWFSEDKQEEVEYLNVSFLFVIVFL